MLLIRGYRGGFLGRIHRVFESLLLLLDRYLDTLTRDAKSGH
jgi:hypothetical protein